jgi:hypothetical protein
VWIDDDAPSHLAPPPPPPPGEALWPADPRNRGRGGGGAALRGASARLPREVPGPHGRGIGARECQGSGGGKEGGYGGGLAAVGTAGKGLAGCGAREDPVPAGGDESGAYVKFGRQRKWVAARLVARDINPAGGLAVLASGLVVIGDADNKCLRVFRPCNERFIECGRVGPPEIALLAGHGGELPLFEMRGIAARGFVGGSAQAVAADEREATPEKAEMIEVVFADNHLQPSKAHQPALFRVVLRESVEGQWQVAAWDKCAHHGTGVGQVDDPGKSCARFLVPSASATAPPLACMQLPLAPFAFFCASWARGNGRGNNIYTVEAEGLGGRG